MHNGKSYSGGKFDNEVHAAMKVNLLCDKYGIKRKNPNFIIEPDAIQKVMTLIIYSTKRCKKQTLFAFY